VILFFLLSAFADTQLWTKAAFRKKIYPKVHLVATQHLRLEENISAIESVIPELELGWKASSWLDLGLGHRYFWRRTKNDTLERAYRTHLDVKTEYSLNKKLEVGYRLRLQDGRELDETERKQAVRHKIKGSYAYTKSWEPNVFVEYYVPHDGEDKIQFCFGTKYKLNKRNRFGFRLIWENFMISRAGNLIFSIGYEYRAKKKKKKKS
jgi:hypothetical protein